MTARHDELKRILAEGLEQEVGLKNTLRRVMDRRLKRAHGHLASVIQRRTEALDGFVRLWSQAALAS